MKIQSSFRKTYIPTWVKPDLLEKYWALNTNYYIDSWQGQPDAGWFAYEIPDVKTGFITADMYLKELDGNTTVGFVNGRHRTRWLMTHNRSLIPVGLEEDCYQKAIRLGLAVGRVSAEEVFNA